MLPKPPIPGVLVAILLVVATVLLAGEEAGNSVIAVRAQTAFDMAQRNYLADTNSTAAACQLARTSFDLADLATNDTRRAEIARRGIEVCRWWLVREPKSGPGHYYLAMNLGKLAQAEAPSLASYRLVHEMEREFKLAAELDVKFDHAGPARTLGELYFEAPGWPLSVGSRHKAGEWLARAVRLAPEFPENQLNLAEAQLKWREPEALAATLKNIDAIWPAARTNFTGAAWEADWVDWDARRAALKTEFPKVFKHVP